MDIWNLGMVALELMKGKSVSIKKVEQNLSNLKD